MAEEPRGGPGDHGDRDVDHEAPQTLLEAGRAADEAGQEDEARVSGEEEIDAERPRTVIEDEKDDRRDDQGPGLGVEGRPDGRKIGKNRRQKERRSGDAEERVRAAQEEMALDIRTTL